LYFGKDRTALICALVLSLCGVDDDIVAEEYSLSDIGLEALRDEIVNSLLRKDVFRSDPEEAKKLVLATYVFFER
jgi:protein tyrosine/serine phosphatase